MGSSQSDKDRNRGPPLVGRECWVFPCARRQAETADLPGGMPLPGAPQALRADLQGAGFRF